MTWTDAWNAFAIGAALGGGFRTAWEIVVEVVGWIRRRMKR